MEEIRLGTIGSGVIVHSILDSIHAVEGICCRAVYSRTREKGEALAKKYHVPRVYTDMEAFLSDDTLNFIYIASPNSLHYQQIKNALNHGKNVICEKPFCARAQEVKEVIALARARGLFLIDAVPTAFLPNFEIIKKQLPKIGPVKLVLCNYTQYSSRYDQLLDGAVPNVFNPEFAGGCLQDINFYNVYFAVALFGKPLETVYFANRYQNLADTSGVMLMRYDGFVCAAAGSKDARGESLAQIEGEKGYIAVQGGSNGIAQVRVVTKDSDEIFNAQEHSDRWLYEVEEMTRMILADDYRRACRLLDTTVNVMDVIETSRKKEGIFFPGDEPCLEQEA
jgi:predicted dehydrogenase